MFCLHCRRATLIPPFPEGATPKSCLCVCTSEHCPAGVPSRSPKGVVGGPLTVPGLDKAVREWGDGSKRKKEQGRKDGKNGSQGAGPDHLAYSTHCPLGANSAHCKFKCLPQPDLGSLGLIVHCCSIMLKSLSRSWLLCWVGCLFFWSFVLPALGCLCYLLSKTF